VLCEVQHHKLTVKLFHNTFQQRAIDVLWYFSLIGQQISHDCHSPEETAFGILQFKFAIGRVDVNDLKLFKGVDNVDNVAAFEHNANKAVNIGYFNPKRNLAIFIEVVLR
jgi:hypothetical protein